jgi:ATP/maltotriose-dependent transcriptional regulator MalT
VWLVEKALLGLLYEHENADVLDAQQNDVKADLQRADAALDNALSFCKDALDKLNAGKPPREPRERG